MTFREKLAKEHPERVNDTEIGGCFGCPEIYGYEPHHACILPLSGETFDQRCTRCWNREIPNNGGDIT